MQNSSALRPSPDFAPQILNPAETFGDIIVDYSYVECTSACITALVAFQKQHPDHRTGEIKAALKRAEAFIRSIQRSDVSMRLLDWPAWARFCDPSLSLRRYRKLLVLLFSRSSFYCYLFQRHTTKSQTIQHGFWGVCFTYKNGCDVVT